MLEQDLTRLLVEGVLLPNFVEQRGLEPLDHGLFGVDVDLTGLDEAADDPLREVLNVLIRDPHREREYGTPPRSLNVAAEAMRAVVQRVKEASVAVDGAVVSKIGPGALVLLGVAKGDTSEDAATLADKTVNLRIFDDEAGVMNRSAVDAARELLVVSQFTLLGDARKGRRPSYIDAAEPDVARGLYEEYCDAAERALGRPVGRGVFRAMMDVGLVNAGPVTILLDTRKAF